MKQSPNNTERPRGTPPEREKVEKKREESQKLRETSQEFGEGVSEVVESVESQIESGEVSEKTGEDKKKGPQGQLPTKGGAKTAVKIKPLVFPKIEIMQIQVATAIKKEIAVLEKTAEEVSHKPYELSNVVGKIRELKYILSNLTHVTFETLKGWWMKFVKKNT